MDLVFLALKSFGRIAAAAWREDGLMLDIFDAKCRARVERDGEDSQTEVAEGGLRMATTVSS